MKYAFMILCLYAAVIVVQQKNNSPIVTQTKNYTRIKKGMENAFLDRLCGTDSALIAASKESYLEDDKEVFPSEKESKEMLAQMLDEKKSIWEINFSDNKPLNIENENPDSIYYLYYSRSYKESLIHLDSIKHFLE